MNIKSQAKKMGHEVVGKLKRVEDDVFTEGENEVHIRQYVDSEGTLYAVNQLGRLVYIAGDTWVM